MVISIPGNHNPFRCLCCYIRHSKIWRNSLWLKWPLITPEAPGFCVFKTERVVHSGRPKCRLPAQRTISRHHAKAPGGIRIAGPGGHLGRWMTPMKSVRHRLPPRCGKSRRNQPAGNESRRRAVSTNQAPKCSTVCCKRRWLRKRRLPPSCRRNSLQLSRRK